MSTVEIQEIASQEYKYGFVTDIEADQAPPGLTEDIIRFISAKKEEPEWMLEWRLKAFRHWLTMTEPKWANVHYPPIDYQAIRYYSAPKQKKTLESLDEVEATESGGRGLGRRGQPSRVGGAGQRRGCQAEPLLAGELDLAELVADHELLDRGQDDRIRDGLDVETVAGVGRDPASARVRTAQ